MSPGLPADLNRHRLLNSEQTAEFLARSIKDIHRLRKSGRLPPAIKIGERTYAWRLGDLVDFVVLKAAERAA
jgi:predicted DNA-binding transcriptional regulator AlpA